MRTSFVRISIFTVSTILIFADFNFAAGEELNLNPLDAVNTAGIKSIDTRDTVKGFKFNLPFSVKNMNIGTNIPISPKFNTSQGISDINLRQFLTPKDISSDDLGKAVKAVITLVIEIFLVVISITSQILKLILEFLR